MPKRRYETTNLRRVKSQNNADLIHTLAEAWNHGRFPKRLNCSEMPLTPVSKDILPAKRRLSDLVMSFHFWHNYYLIFDICFSPGRPRLNPTEVVSDVLKNMALGEIFLRILLHFSFPCMEDTPRLVTADLLPAKCYIDRLFLTYAPLHLSCYNIPVTGITLVRAL